MIAKTTLSDVARRVGASASSISRVLSRAHGVNEETRSEALRAVRTMKYQAGAVSRETGRSRLIGFLMPAEDGVCTPNSATKPRTK